MAIHAAIPPFAAALAGCDPRSQQPAATTRQAVTLQFWSRFFAGAGGTGTVVDGLEARNVPVFMERYAPIKVERTPTSDAGPAYAEKLLVSFAGGTGPDVFNIGSPGIAQFGAPGYGLALDGFPLVRKESEDFIGPPLNVGRYKGKLFGLTYFCNCSMPVYRKDLLTEVGLPSDRRSLPKTWDQFRDVTRRLAKWEGGQLTRSGFDVPKSDFLIEALFDILVKQQGKEPLNADHTKVAFDGPEGERALQLLADLINRDRVDSFQRPALPRGVPPVATPLVASAFSQGAVVADVKTAGLNPSDLLVADFTPEFGSKPTASAFLGGTWVMANQATKTPNEAVELLVYLTGLEHTLPLAERTTTLPARKSAANSPYLQDPLYRPYYEALTTAWAVPQHPKYEQIRQKMVAVFPQALQQQRSVKEALAEVAVFSNALLSSG